MKVTVTQEDIAIGGHSCICCPVHRAIARSMGPQRPAFAVHHDRLIVDGTDDCFPRIVGFPSEVSSWICDYDAGAKVGPISFELEYEKHTS